MILTARFLGLTHSEGAGRGNLSLQFSVHTINGEWPNFPPGPGELGNSGGMAYLDVRNAMPLGGGVFQGVGQFKIQDGAGVNLFADSNIMVTFTADTLDEVNAARADMGLEPLVPGPNDVAMGEGWRHLSTLDATGVADGDPYVLRDLNPITMVVKDGDGHRSAPDVELVRSTKRAGGGRAEIRGFLTAK